MTHSCTCDICRAGCTNQPGWFTPDQIPDLLKHFNVNSIEELLPKGFAIDWFLEDEEEGFENDVLTLAPNTTKNEGNMQYPADPRGTCIFFKNQRCSIYEVRPFECADAIHTDGKGVSFNRRKNMARLWEQSDLLKEFEDKVTCEGLSIFSLIDILSGLR